MKLPLLLLLLGFFLSYTAEAHNLIQGHVLNAQTHAPLAGANILVKNMSIGTTTDALGKFTLKTDTTITSITISYVGFETQEIQINQPGEHLLINLEPAAFELNQVSVSAGNINPINTMTRLDVNLRPLTSSQDALRIVPGLFIAQHAGGGKAEQIFLRGFDIDHGTDIQVSADGMPVNMLSHAHGQGYADLHFLIPELIQTIDFGKGPYYTEHGNLNTAGYVDFHTYDVPEKNMIKVEGGQFNTLRALAVTDILGKTAAAEGQHAYVAGEYYATNGPFDTPQNFNRINLFGKYTSYLGDNSRLSVQLSTFRSKWDASGQIPERAVKSGLITRFGAMDATEGGYTGRTNAIVRHIRRLENEATLDQELFYTKYNFELYSDFTFFLEDPVHGDQIRQKEQRDIVGYQAKYIQTHYFPHASLTSLAGAGFRYDDVHNDELSHTQNRWTTLDTLSLGNVNETNGYMYLDETLESGPWMLNLSVRLDYFKFDYVDKLQPVYQTQSVQKSMLNPKLNAVYHINPKIQAYLKSGTGFHSNDTRVVVAQKGREILPRAYGTDVGMILKPTSRLLLNMAYWYLFLEQEFVYVGDAAIVEPSGQTRRQGLDVSIRWQWIDWLFVDLDLNGVIARSVHDPEGQNYIPLAPALTSIGGLTFQPKSPWSGSVRYRYMQNRPANEDNSTTARGYTVLDAMVNYTRPGFQIGLAIQNLFNTAWNEAQFATESRLKNEPAPVEELHFTPGTPFFLKVSASYYF